MARVIEPAPTDHLGAVPEIVMVTPQMAKDLLEGNVRNRTKRDRKVEQYARDMKAGRWPFTAESIQIAPDGLLLNGQHRLMALIEAGMTLPFLIVRGIHHEAQLSMDTGAKRTPSDALTLRNEVNSSMLASMIRVAIEIGREADLKGNSGTRHTSTGEVMEFLDAHPETRWAAALAMRTHRAADAPYPSVWGYTIWRTAAIHQYEAEQFALDVAEKVGLPKHDPALTLSNKFRDVHRDRKKITRAIQASMTLRAWNNRRRGEKLISLREMVDGRPIPIPTPI